MDLAAILADVQIAISIAKLAYQLGQDAGPYIDRAYKILFEQKTLSDEERADMMSQEAQWRKEIDDAIAADDAAANP